MPWGPRHLAAAYRLIYPIHGTWYYVRADGTASDAESATSPDAAGTAMNLAVLLSESIAGKFGRGAVIAFSDQGGEYTTFPDRPTEQYVSQVYLATGVIYTNVPGENPTFNPPITTGGDSGQRAQNFLANGTSATPNDYIDNPTGVLVVSHPAGGEIRLRHEYAAANVEINGTSGGGVTGYGIEFRNIVVEANYLTGGGGTNDAFSSNNNSSVLIVGGSVSNIYDVEGTPTITYSAQAFTTHNQSRMRVRGVTCTNVNHFITPVGDSYLDISDCTVTGVYKSVLGGTNTTSPGPTVTVTNCTVDTGALGVAQDYEFVASNGATAYATFTVSDCTFTLGSEASNMSNTSANVSYTFNNCIFNFNTGSGGQWTVQDMTLIFNDCSFVITGVVPTRRFRFNTGSALFKFERCKWDCTAMNYSNNAWMYTHIGFATQFANGSGLYACEIWDNSFNAFFEAAYPTPRSPASFNFPFKNCTFHAATTNRTIFDLVAGDTAGLVEFENCHFSGHANANEIVNQQDGGAARSTTTNCSFYDSTQGDTDNTNPVTVSTEADEGFKDKANYDFSIWTSSVMRQQGTSPPPVTTDRAGKAYQDPASIGAYETE